MRIAVLGAGSWGTTLAILLSFNKHDVVLWSHRRDHADELRSTRENKLLLPGITIPPAIAITNDLDEAASGVDVVLNAVPAQFVRSVLERLPSRSVSNWIIVNVAKGIELGTLRTMSEVILDALPAVEPAQVCTLSGPSFAEEVARNVPTAVVGASSNSLTAQMVQKIFMTPWFRVYSSEDIRGVELGGSVKNVIAIGAGIADGAGFGDNTKAAIMVRATAEFSRLGNLLGAQPKTFAGLSGIGDLIVTCMSKHSRNRFVGEQIGRGRKLADILSEMVMVAEGVATAKSVHALAHRQGIEMPIVRAVYEILFEEKDPIRATYDLMTRDAKSES